MLVVGPNGAGKTNLLESLHVGTQGFSPRTRNDASLIRFGREGARIALAGERAGSRLELNVVLQAGSAKRASLNGARLQTAEQLRGEVATLVFTPDRLVVVKGGPAARRAYFDRALGRGTPPLAALPAEYGAALAQRNSPLRLRFAEGELTVSARTQDVGEAEEALPVSFAGEPLEIGFNAEFLRDGIESVAGDTLRFRLISPLRPCVLQAEEGSEDFLYLIMPIRLAG